MASNQPTFTSADRIRQLNEIDKVYSLAEYLSVYTAQRLIGHCRMSRNLSTPPASQSRP